MTVSTKFDAKISEAVAAISAETKISQSAVVARALRLLPEKDRQEALFYRTLSEDGTECEVDLAGTIVTLKQEASTGIWKSSSFPSISFYSDGSKRVQAASKQRDGSKVTDLDIAIRNVVTRWNGTIRNWMEDRETLPEAQQRSHNAKQREAMEAAKQEAQAAKQEAASKDEQIAALMREVEALKKSNSATKRSA